MDWRWAAGAGAGLLLAGLFAYVAAPGGTTEPLPEPVDVPTTARPAGDRPLDDGLKTSPSRDRRKGARDRAGASGRMRAGGGFPNTQRNDRRTPDERRAFKQQLQQRVQAFSEAEGLSLQESRELRRILRDLDRAQQDIDNHLDKGDKPEKWARATASDVRVKSELRLIDLLGDERASAAMDAFSDMLDGG